MISGIFFSMLKTEFHYPRRSLRFSYEFDDFLDIAESPYQRKISIMDPADVNINKTRGRKWCHEELSQRLRGNFISQDGVLRLADFLDIAEFLNQWISHNMDPADVTINKTLGRKWCQEQLFQRLSGNSIGQDGVLRLAVFFGHCWMPIPMKTS